MRSYKLSGITVCLIAVLSLAACGGGSGADAAAAPAAVVSGAGAGAGDAAVGQAAGADPVAQADPAATPAAPPETTTPETAPEPAPPAATPATTAETAPISDPATDPTTTPTVAAAKPKMVLKSVNGAVLSAEIASFKAYIATLVPATDNIGNAWAQGKSGVELKAMGMVYEISGDAAILQKMISYCDTLLASRNDLAAAPAGQQVAWTGVIAPVWPNVATVAPALAAAGAEQGDPIGHLAYCAKHILRTPAIAKQVVTGGDPHGYGKTYLERARKYVKAGDQSARYFVLRNLITLDSGGLYRFSAASPYKTGQIVPWNQQMMLNYAFMTLSEDHQLLNDNAELEKQYRAIAAVNIAAFFKVGVTSYNNKDGRASYNWGYTLPALSGEDSNHGALDVAGLYRAFDDGSYGVTTKQMETLANTYIDVMMLGPKQYAGRVDGSSGTGHAAATTYIRNSYLLLAQFRPDAYSDMMAQAITPGVGTAAIDLFANVLWLKNKREAAAASQ